MKSGPSSCSARRVEPLGDQPVEALGAGGADREVVEHDADVVELAHRRHLGGWAQPAAAVAHDMPVSLEPAQCLADRRAAGREALGQLLLDEALAVRVLALEQGGAQFPVDFPARVNRVPRRLRRTRPAAGA